MKVGVLGAGTMGNGIVEVAQHDVMTVLGEDLGDAVAHRPRAEDADLHYLEQLHGQRGAVAAAET